MDRLPAEVGSTVELTDVLLLGDNGDVRVGTPTVQGARVLAEVVEHGRDKKLIVFKYKAKVRYRRKQGHRQGYTRLAIRRILTGEEPAAAVEPAAAEPKPKRAARRRAKPAAEAETPAAEAAATTAVEAAPRRPRRTATAGVEPAQQPAAEAEAPAAEPTGTKAGKAARRSRTKPALSGAEGAAAEGEEPKPVRRRSKKTESD